ncbi:Zn(2)-C6 fungal-type domain-containing protein [Fusarium keratoplasticum]|uniref:Zn(2)-C6 fungal-type domain-containing protein n=1 Tax=Fusarium keratoplasticum TaxID=1328300 RepID=A0ACC0RED3_9HYPO|nr:Zn(2)-C6 fungal-type domain-containing protein [Fusarium keratoplasticum]KAI8680546.1 Zn(2)-C6 fungal-type domain-containing protein [Fusarium keratoplasticum]
MSPLSSRPAPSLGDNGLLSSVSRCRSLLPAPVSNSEGSTSGSDQGPSLPSLRPRANLTKIACESCRKRKAKCCGERPKCRGCINRGVQCHYQDSGRDQHVLKRKYDEIQKKANTYEQLYHLLTCLPEREAQGILRRLREGADVATTTRQVKDGDLPLQPAWSPETRLHYEFPYSTSMPAALLSPDNPYLGSPVFEITSHALPQSAEQTEVWASQSEMSSKYRPLLPNTTPASSSTEDASGSQSQSSLSGLVQIPRTGIRAACESCREKTRCNGGRPMCNRCIETTTECIYRTDEEEKKVSALERRNGEVIAELEQLRELSLELC